MTLDILLVAAGVVAYCGVGGLVARWVWWLCDGDGKPTHPFRGASQGDVRVLSVAGGSVWPATLALAGPVWICERVATAAWNAPPKFAAWRVGKKKQAKLPRAEVRK